MNHTFPIVAKYLSDIVRDAICLKPNEHALVIYDTEAPLTRIILEGYRTALPEGQFVDIASVTVDEVKELIGVQKTGDLVILLQSTNFRLNEFRLRIELFARGIKTIEHTHLTRIPEDQFERYINALAYDAPYYQKYGHGLKKVLDVAQEIIVECAGTKLVYSGPMEDTKLNIGDYSKMKNVGGTYPIGEVFTESKDLKTVNGEAMIFAYADNNHLVRIVEPFKVIITEGILVSPDAPQEFQEILDLIREDEAVTVREFGLGLNCAMGKNMLVSDITAFERQKGMHLSLGAKHTVYAKQGIHRKKGRYHVDIFVDIEQITVDGTDIYKDGDFIVS